MGILPEAIPFLSRPKESNKILNNLLCFKKLSLTLVQRTSNPRMLLQSGFNMIWVREVTIRVVSVPSEPWTITERLSWQQMNIKE